MFVRVLPTNSMQTSHMSREVINDQATVRKTDMSPEVRKAMVHAEVVSPRDENFHKTAERGEFVANADHAAQASEERVEDQIAEAMANPASSSDVKLLPKMPIELLEQIIAAGRRKGLEKVIVDDKFTVVAVDDWAEVVPRSSSESEYIGKDLGTNENQEVRASVSAPVAGSQDENFLDHRRWGRPYYGLRRASSCSRIHDLPRLLERLNFSRQDTYEVSALSVRTFVRLSLSGSIHNKSIFLAQSRS